MNFVHISDLHVGRHFKSASFAKGFGRVKREAIGDNFQTVIEYCNDNQVDMMLIAGDFIDSDYVDITDMYDLVYRLKQLMNTQVVMIAGNHDPLFDKGSVYNMVSWPDFVHIMGTTTEILEFKSLDTCVIGRSWANKGPMVFDQKAIEVHLEKTTMTNKIVLLHGDCYLDNGYHYMDPKILKSLRASYYALGHIHKPDVLEDILVYPGSLEPLDFKELGDHGFISGEIINGKAHFEQILSMVHGMVYVNIDITGVESFLDVVDRSRQALDMVIEQSMVRLQLRGEKEVTLGEISEKLYDALRESVVYPKGHIAYIELKDLTVPAYDLETLRQEHTDDIIGKYIEALIKVEDELSQDALKEGLTLLLEG